MSNTTALTLSAANPTVTITGAISAFGTAGTYPRAGFTNPVYAAVFAPAPTTFHITNEASIQATLSGGTSVVTAYGIAIGAAADITNRGTIAGPSGIGAFGTAASYLENTGQVTGTSYDGAAFFNGPATIANSGTITGNQTGIKLLQGGLVTNAADAGTIHGGYAAIAAYAASTIFNANNLSGDNGAVLQGTETSYFYSSGNIDAATTLPITNIGTGHNGAGILLETPGTVLNAGAITATNAGIFATASATAADLIINTGNIRGAGTLTQGIYAAAYAFITNTGYISVSGQGIMLPTGWVSNTGTILAPGADAIDSSDGHDFNSGLLEGANAVALQSGGIFINTGTVTATRYGVTIHAGAIVENDGTIAGGHDAIYFDHGNTNILLVSPGAVFEGDVDGGDAIGAAGVSLLELKPAASATLGILDSFGSQFTGFQTLSFGFGASWTVEGSLSAFDSGLSITGFSAFDTLDIASPTLVVPATICAGGTLAVTLNNIAEQLLFDPALAGQTLATAPDGTGGTDLFLTDSVSCFCPGTRIATPRGPIPIENLKIGDVVSTHLGPQPIQWIGTSAYNPALLAKHLYPIKIRRHAIAQNIPSRDLYVSPDHAICEAGVLIHAHLLTNGASITQVESLEETLIYLHLELPRHAILFANNTPTESFIDEASRHRFQNAHTAPHTPPQSPCLPRIFEGFHLANITTRLNRRAGLNPPSDLGPLRGQIDESTPTLLRGWAQNSAAPNHPVTLEIISGTQKFKIIANTYREDLRKAGLGHGRHAFSIPLPNLATPPQIRRLEDAAPLAPPTPNPRHAGLDPASTPLRKTNKQSLF